MAFERYFGAVADGRGRKRKGVLSRRSRKEDEMERSKAGLLSALVLTVVAARAVSIITSIIEKQKR